MAVDWYEDAQGELLALENDEEMLYCPYTNGPVCAAAQKGWRIQELCKALECEQIKFLPRAKRRRHRKAA